MRKLGYLGPPGTFSHTAAMQYAAATGLLPVCCSGLETVFRQVQSGQMEAGVVPVENSTGGTVGETLDLLLTMEGVYITGELLLPVRQHLLARPDTKLHEIKKIYSHPQALSQCRRVLQERLPGVPVTETASTAAAAFLVSASSGAPVAAVGSTGAAENYGLEILSRDIHDNKDNVTRFLVLGREKTPPREPARTSLVLAVKDRPGALYHILRGFAMHKINLTRIESRPAGKKLGDYIFFIDFLGRDDNPAVRAAIAETGQFILWYRLLGSYPVDRAAGEPDPERQIPAEETVNLAEIRKKIDMVDNEILHLLVTRRYLVDDVARLKAGKREIVDRQREDEIVDRVRKLAAENNLDPDLVEKIYRLIIQGSVHRQQELMNFNGSRAGNEF